LKVLRNAARAALVALLPCVAAPSSAPACAMPAAAASQAAPAADDRPLDARTYAQALEAARQGRRDEAARLLRKVFEDFPASPYAAPALFKVAEFRYPVAAWEQVGSATPPVVKEAGELLATLAQKYRSSREAPRALVRLGYLGLEPANPKADLGEACGRFTTAAQLYPDSDAADDALFASGMCETLRDRPAQAADDFSRLLEEHPDSPLAAETMYRLGMALSHLDDPAEAMMTLQAVRNRYPESRFAPRALDRISLLHRLRLAPPLLPQPKTTEVEGRPVYRLDDAYGAGGAAPPAPSASSAPSAPSAMSRAASNPPKAESAVSRPADLAFKGGSDIAIDAQGLAVIASPRSPGVFRLDARGRVQERIAHPGPSYVAVGEGLAVFIAGADQIAVNARNWSGADLKGADGRPPREFGPLAVDATGRVYLLDPRDNAVLIFDRNRRLVGTLRPDTKEGRFIDVAKSEDGAVYVFEGRNKVVLEMTQGKEARRINLTPLGVVEPVSLAADGLGDLFVLDGRTGWVHVTDPDGKRIAVIRPPKEAADRLGEASAVAVDALGRVYVCGRKSPTVLRYR
jgi:TolA-binding protein